MAGLSDLSKSARLREEREIQHSGLDMVLPAILRNNLGRLHSIGYMPVSIIPYISVFRKRPIRRTSLGPHLPTL